MPTEIQCPKCRSANVMCSKKRNLHICEDCQCEFVLEKVVKPMRIFLSYGHDANEELVRRIKTDLVNRGHDVWFDKTDHRNAQRVVRSLAFQFATRLLDYRKLLLSLPEIAELDRKHAAELFDYFLANPPRSVIHGGRDRYLVVIDGLDEAGEVGRNPLVEMLARNAQRLPDWLGLAVSSGPVKAVTARLRRLNSFVVDMTSNLANRLRNLKVVLNDNLRTFELWNA